MRDLKIEVNKQIASDINKLLKQKEFQRFYFWLLEETGAFSMPDIRIEGQALSFKEGQRAIGMGLVAMPESYQNIDACRAAYRKMVDEVQQILNNREE